VRHLLRDADRIRRYSDIRAYTSQGPSRLEVLASDQDPAVSEAFSEEDYRRTIDLYTSATQAAFHCMSLPTAITSWPSLALNS